MMSYRRTGVIVTLFLSVFIVDERISLAIDEFADLKTINELPSTLREIQNAFRMSRAESCEIVRANEPVDLTSFTTVLTARDRRLSTKFKTLLPSTRQSVLSVGLTFSSADKQDLPALARSSIVEYVDQHYLQIQARVRRDLLDRKLYYHHRPLALTARYQGSRLTAGFDPIVSRTVEDFRGLGLFVSEETRILKPEMFRTMVLLFRTRLLVGEGRSTDSYEFVFIRGRESRTGTSLENHVFVTTDDRTELIYLRNGTRAVSPRRVSILGSIAITRFDNSGLYPRESAVRSYKLDQKRSFVVSDLESYVSSLGLEGRFAKNLTIVLDDIIDGKIIEQAVR